MRRDRLAILQLVRVVIGGAVVAAVWFVDALPVRHWHATQAVVAWLLVTSVVEIARRTSRVPGVGAPLAVLMLDGIVLGLFTANTGGYRSPLLSLIYLHVVAVSLLVSHRVALRIAVWHGFLLFAGFVAASSSSLGLALHDEVHTAGRLAALHASGFLLVAIGVAACAALNEQVVRRAHRELSAIAAVGSALTGSIDVDGVLVAAADAARGALGLERVAIVTSDGDTWRSATSAPEATILLDGHSVTMVAAIQAIDAPRQARTLSATALDVVVPDAANVLVVPFGETPAHGMLLLVFGGGASRRIPQSLVTTAGNVARLVAATLENARLHARVEHLATRDGLTGLANRRLFDEAIADDVARARRSGEPFSLVVLDVDHFKAVNDAHGHQAGDAVLRRVAAGLAASTRDSELAARYGGEEFVVLLRGCGIDAAHAAAERLRRAAVVPDGPVPVTVSAGVATFPVQAGDAAALIEAADSALYEAKAGGRDQTRQSERRRLSLVGRRSA